IDDLPPAPVEVRLPSHPADGKNSVPGVKQSHAHIRLKAVNGLFRLPGLSPHEDITDLRIKPDLPFQLTRDYYSGLHSVSVSGAKNNQTIAFTYVVQQHSDKQSDKQSDKHHKSYNDNSPMKEWMHRPEIRCSNAIKTRIDTEFEQIHGLPEVLREDLIAIQQAESHQQRLEAIAVYCQQFTGKGKPEQCEHFFQYLLKNRQGNCTHRSAIFVALCRYYGIASRLVNSASHAFPEYSLDGGRSWQSRGDLGGVPTRLDILEPDAQPIQKATPQGSQSHTLPGLFDQHSERKRWGSKRKFRVTKKPGKTAGSSRALPTTDLNIASRIKKLCNEQGLTGLSKSDALLEQMVALLGNDRDLHESWCSGEWYLSRKKKMILEDTLYSGLHNSTGKIADGQIIKRLMDIKKLFMVGNKDINQWFYVLSANMFDADFSCPSTINFVREA
ncbi:transglutaminase-like domain-containing protein, partial [Endozoicomonas sp. ONNA2]|uniref:transglutaminase-like domain-containing protein n=1 Tax=Endozoicomonas sp. ONNA2 TaxID=2828741 RepID=UPI002147228F